MFHIRIILSFIYWENLGISVKIEFPSQSSTGNILVSLDLKHIISGRYFQFSQYQFYIKNNPGSGLSYVILIKNGVHRLYHHLIGTEKMVIRFAETQVSAWDSWDLQTRPPNKMRAFYSLFFFWFFFHFENLDRNNKGCEVDIQHFFSCRALDKIWMTLFTQPLVFLMYKLSRVLSFARGD